MIKITRWLATRSLTPTLVTLLMAFLTVACNQNSGEEAIENGGLEPTPTADQGQSHRLVIDLQDGFSNDTVRVSLNDQVILENSEVTSELLTGLALSSEAEASGTVNLQVEILNRDLAESVTIEMSGDKYIGIAIIDGRLDIFVSDEPFGYG